MHEITSSNYFYISFQCFQNQFEAAANLLFASFTDPANFFECTRHSFLSTENIQITHQHKYQDFQEKYPKEYQYHPIESLLPPHKITQSTSTTLGYSVEKISKQISEQ